MPPAVIAILTFLGRHTTKQAIAKYGDDAVSKAMKFMKEFRAGKGKKSTKASEEAEKNIIKTSKNFYDLMENRKKNAEERIMQLKNQALKDIKNTSVKIAIESVEKLLKNSLDKSKLDKIYMSSIEETKLALKKKSS